MEINQELFKDIDKGFFVYIYQNQISGKMYVGYTTSYKRRLKSHRNADGTAIAFHGAVKKYGWDNFKLLNIIELDSKEEADKREQQKKEKRRNNYKKENHPQFGKKQPLEVTAKIVATKKRNKELKKLQQLGETK